MKDIEKAYLAEQNYIEKNLGTEISLLNLLQPYGYETLEDYFGDKFLYQLKSLNIQINHYLVDKVKDEMHISIANGTPGVFSIDEDCTWAWIGSDEFDYDKAKELNVKPGYLGYRGGTIITDNNDFNIAINLPCKMRVIPLKFLEIFNSYFCDKGYNTHIDNNDILLEDGRKIAGSSFYGNEVSSIWFMSLALSDHTELINQLCKKEQKKKPWYISGITKQEIEEEVNKWLKPNI